MSYVQNHTVFVLFRLLILLSIVPSKFICVVACVGISFFLKALNIQLYVYAAFCLSSLDGHLGAFCFLAAGNTGVPISLQDPAFSSFEYILRSRIAGSCRSSICNLLGNLDSIFQNGGTISKTLPPVVHRAPTFLHP